MSFIQNFNYDRNAILSSDGLGFTGSPIYGASISFTATNSTWYGSNYYSHVMPNGVNSIKAQMSFVFQGNEESVKSLLKRVESATTGVLTGDIAFSGKEDCINFGESKNNVVINLDESYYKNFSGSQIANYGVKNISDNVYEVNISMFNNRVSPVLNNGMGFVADRTIPIQGSSYKKFDVITGATGIANSEVLDNYFYLTEDRASSITQGDLSGLATHTGFSNGATRTFFWEPDQQVPIQVDHSSRINEFKNSFHQQLNISRNQNRIQEIQLNFTNRGEKEAYSILHFLETHLGYKQFIYYHSDNLVNPNRVFYCPNWTHTFNYKDSNTIQARFVEITVPTINFS